MLIILFIALVIRLLGVNSALYVDEAHYTNINAYFGSQYFVENGLGPMEKSLSEQYFASEWNTNPSIAHHPPLTMTLWAVSTAFFGENAFAFRIIPLLFGIVSVFLIYLIAKQNYNERAALFSAGIAAIAFYHVLSSLLIDVHGAIQVSFFLAAIYFFQKSESKRDLVCSAIFAGLALLNVYTGVFLFIILALYQLIKSRAIFETIKKMLKFSLISAAVFSIFPILSFIFNKDIFLRTLLGAGILDLNINFRFLVFLGIWTGPLLLGLAALCFLKRKKQDTLFFLWIGVVALFNIFSYPNASLDRYFMVAIPALCILAGRFLSEVDFKDKHIYAGGILFLGFYTVLLFLNLKNVEYLGHDLGNYISLASQFKWNFFFPITGPVGPTFGVVFSSIVYSLIFSGVFIALTAIFFLMKKPAIAKWALTIFIAISLAFNVLLTEELLVHAAHPNMSSAYNEAIDFYEENDLPEKIYTNNRALFFYLDKTGLNLFSYTEETDERTKELIEGGDITVILFNFPKIPDEEPIWTYLEDCTLRTAFFSKGQSTGVVYVC